MLVFMYNTHQNAVRNGRKKNDLNGLKPKASGKPEILNSVDSNNTLNLYLKQLIS